MRRTLSALVDFVVGDDVLLAAGAAVSLSVAAVAARAGLDPWWLLPLAVPAVLGASLRRARG